MDGDVFEKFDELDVKASLSGGVGCGTVFPALLTVKVCEWYDAASVDGDERSDMRFDHSPARELIGDGNEPWVDDDLSQDTGDDGEDGDAGNEDGSGPISSGEKFTAGLVSRIAFSVSGKSEGFSGGVYAGKGPRS